MKKQLTILLVLYFFLSFLIMWRWESISAYPVTGDEPHYLIISDSIIRYKTFDVSRSYENEFYSNAITSNSLLGTTEDAIQGAHAVRSINGVYSSHNIGLPILLAVPFSIGKIIGAKIFLIFFNCLLIVSSWIICKKFTNNNLFCFYCVLPVCLSLPFLPFTNQIFPDLMAGTISLLAIAFINPFQNKTFLTNNITLNIIPLICISFLPWLQVKYATLSIVLLLSFLYKEIFVLRKSPRNSLLKVLPSVCSFVLLAFYNKYAFDNWFGPYAALSETPSAAFVFNSHSLMVFFGLHFDRFQGVFLQNPIFLISIFFLFRFYKKYKFAAITITFSYLSIMIPNSLHPNWYGGYSFVSRFAMTGTAILIPIALYTLVSIRKWFGVLPYGITIISLFSIQILHFIRYTFLNFNLMNYGGFIFFKQFPWLSEYPSWYPFFNKIIPALYDSRWAYDYVPNFMFFSITLALIILIYCRSFLSFYKTKHSYSKFIICFLLSLLINSFFFISDGYLNPQAGSLPLIFTTSDNMHTDIGSIIDKGGEDIFYFQGHSPQKEGYLAFGPYLEISKPGCYTTITYYSSSSDFTSNVGWIDITDDGSTILNRKLINGTHSYLESSRIDFYLPYRNQEKSLLQVRLGYYDNKNGSMAFRKLEVYPCK